MPARRKSLSAEAEENVISEKTQNATVSFGKKLSAGLRGVLRKTGRFLLFVIRMLCRFGRFLRRVFKKDSAPNLMLMLFAVTALIAAGLDTVVHITENAIAESREAAFQNALNEVFPGNTYTFAKMLDMDEVYKAFDGNGELAGFAVYITVNGYMGPIEMIVGLDRSMFVTGVKVISSVETGGFADESKQAAFLARLVGKRDPSVGGNVDAISGATASSKAVVQGVRNAIALVRGGNQP